MLQNVDAGAAVGWGVSSLVGWLGMVRVSVQAHSLCFLQQAQQHCNPSGTQRNNSGPLTRNLGRREQAAERGGGSCRSSAPLNAFATACSCTRPSAGLAAGVPGGCHQAPGGAWAQQACARHRLWGLPDGQLWQGDNRPRDHQPVRDNTMCQGYWRLGRVGRAQPNQQF